MPANVPSEGALQWGRRLVRLSTISHQSNLALIECIADHLRSLAIPLRLSHDDQRRKANLFATIGEGKPDGVILSGHTDTVPWDGQDWSVDPLSAMVQHWPSEGGGPVPAGPHDELAALGSPRLYGRGAADMKGFIAVALANAEAFLESNAPFAVHFAFSYDEEVGCFGVRELIADMKEQNIQPMACIIGEPTSMVPAIAHKGVYRYRCCVRGKEAHSSLTPQSVNAIEMAARVVG